MSGILAELGEKISRLPEEPGIYVFVDGSGTPLYVGKAKSLRRRVVSYGTRELEPRLAAMVAEARDLEFLVTRSESEALELENNWIKRHRPRYNVLLRDDKTYPYLKVTVEERWPRIAFTRRIRPDGAEYFGPFLPGGLARRAIKLVQKLFRLRVCRIEIDGRLPRPCLYYDMRRCLGPCVDGLTDESAYQTATDQTRLFLAGRTDRLSRELHERMEGSAERLEFEEAARLRDVLAEIEELGGGRSRLSSVEGEDADVVGLCVRGARVAMVILVMRGGRILDRQELFWEEEAPVAPERLLAEILPQVYSRTTFIPKEIHLGLQFEGDEAFTEWLSQRKGERVFLRYPARGPRASRVALAQGNAEVAFRRRFRGVTASEEAGPAALAEHLELADAPRRIEGFDISTFHGGETVASLVVWQEGRLRKSDYRSFNIRGLTLPDDFASMRQAVERHYRRRLEEVGEMPDLILIDGGRGQLNAALAALAHLGAEDTPIVSLAKREEEIYRPDSPEPLRLPARDPGLQLLQHLRDEAHRFAVGRHRARRNRNTLASRLDRLPGIGPARRRQLLQRFGSATAVAAASESELIAALGPALGRRLFATLSELEGRAAAGPGDADGRPAGTNLG